MAIGFGTRAKALGYSAAIRLAIGSDPVVKEYPDYIQISFTPDQQKALTSYIESQMKKGPSDVRVDIAPIITPIAMKKVLPFAFLALSGAYMLGKRKLSKAFK